MAIIIGDVNGRTQTMPSSLPTLTQPIIQPLDYQAMFSNAITNMNNQNALNGYQSQLQAYQTAVANNKPQPVTSLGLGDITKPGWQIQGTPELKAPTAPELQSVTNPLTGAQMTWGVAKPGTGWTPEAYGYTGRTGIAGTRGTAKYGFQTQMWDALSRANQDMAKAGLGTFGVTDGWRSYEAQVSTKKSKGALAATPGNSVHGLGLAADLDLNSRQQAWLEANGAKYGLGRLPSESWHWQLLPSQFKGASTSSSKPATGGSNYVMTNYHPGIGNAAVEGGFGTATGGRIVRNDKAPLGYQLKKGNKTYDYVIAVPRDSSLLGKTVNIGGIEWYAADTYGGKAHGNTADMLALPDRYNQLINRFKQQGYYQGTGANAYSSGQPLIGTGTQAATTNYSPYGNQPTTKPYLGMRLVY